MYGEVSSTIVPYAVNYLAFSHFIHWPEDTLRDFGRKTLSQVLGSEKDGEAFAEVLKKLGSRRVLVVHGHDGMDEITLTTTTRCSELKDGAVKTYDIDPASFFGETCENKDLEGGEPADNAQITRGILEGRITGPKRDIVLLNSAASLLAGNKCADLADGIKQSVESIDSGAALDKLEKLVAFSKT